MNTKVALITIQLILLLNVVAAQNITQVIKGKIVDKETQSPLPGANVAVIGTDPLMGAIADINGEYSIANVPVGRYNIKISFIGYNDIILSEVLVGSGKEVLINVELSENIISSNEVFIRASKSEPINSMASVSARQFSVEEANRYAGGFDDPAHLASSFAGVSSNLGNNGIVIRGNAPKGLLWRMEGIEITNPSHFANVTSFGAGAITALSSQVMSNSDFYTGAFPAEYGNALSGVFDIKLRTGNSDKHEHTFQAGVVGLDFSSEGPFVKGRKASYLFNYRYSTFALIAPVLPPEMGKLKYQDLSFKLNFPTDKTGTLSLWGIGALDYQGRDAKSDSASWELDFDRQEYNTDLFMSAMGLSHRIAAGSKTYFNSTIALTGNCLFVDQKSYNEMMNLLPTDKIDNQTWKYTFSSFMNHKFNPGHTNKTGVIINLIQYNLNIRKAGTDQSTLETYSDEKGKSYRMQAYSQSKYSITENLTLNMGLHSQFFTLNNNFTIEPRTGFTWDITPVQTLGMSYGLHSQLEMLNFYFVRRETTSGFAEPNKKLGFSKAHHLVLSYNLRVNEFSQLKIEPYFQKLFSIPVIPGSYYSLQNIDRGFYFNDSLINEGNGRNIGIDLTFEKFLDRGYYYLLTTSVFDSKYRGGDGIERNSRFNKNYVINLLGGKEWEIGKLNNKIININGKLSFMGGDFMNPLDIDASFAARDIVEDVSNAFTQRKPNVQILSVSSTYRINKPGHSSIWSLNFINVLGYKEFNSYYFDRTTYSIKKDENQLVIPNISYKIEF